MRDQVTPNVLFSVLVREGGVEPPRAFAHWILSPARLPVSPLSREVIDYQLIRILRPILGLSPGLCFLVVVAVNSHLVAVSSESGLRSL